MHVGGRSQSHGAVDGQGPADTTGLRDGWITCQSSSDQMTGTEVTDAEGFPRSTLVRSRASKAGEDGARALERTSTGPRAWDGWVAEGEREGVEDEGEG